MVLVVTCSVRMTAARAARLSCAGEGVGHDELAELLDKAMVAPEVVIALGRRRSKADLDQVAGRQQVDELGRQVAGHDAVALALLR